MELDEVLAACRIALQSGDRCLLAMLVKVEGSSYRKAGARMLITSAGVRTGTLSGGCLESEIQRKAWWQTEQGPVIQQYRTSSEDGSGMPYGMGCSGLLHVLLKRVEAQDAARMASLESLRKQRIGTSLATTLSGPDIGAMWLYSPNQKLADEVPVNEFLGNAEALFYALKRVAEQTATSEYLHSHGAEYFVEALPPTQRLVIFGAGEDARPLVQFARILGWDVIVGDGRAHLATTARFPNANTVVAAPAAELPAQCGVRADDAVVVMTHSFEQDEALLKILLTQPLRYLGQLGPRQRTGQLLAALASDAGALPASNALYSPIGLDIGAHTPETIALAIIAEVQSVLSQRERAAGARTEASAAGVPAGSALPRVE